VLDLGDGHRVGEIADAAEPVGSAGGRLVVRRGDAVVALDASTEEVIWEAALPAWSPLVRLAGSDDTVYLAVSGRYGDGPCPLD
jgi:outer membrane protein assembly factor BamB